MSRRGYKIIGVSKSTGGLYNGNGMDVNALWMYYKCNKSFEGFTGAEEADPAELLLRESDILIPAAAENQITSRNARQSQGPYPVRGCKRSHDGQRGRHSGRQAGVRYP